jgi:hypothetical protein
LTLALALAAAACSGDDDGNGGGGDGGDGATPTATTDEGATTIEPLAPGCADPSVAREEPANDREVGDLDGDGRPDTVWVASPGGGRRVLGVEAAAGGGDAVDIASASPVALLVLVADADETPPVELFVSDSRGVQLWAFDDCRLQPVTDPEGRPYVFDLGLRGYGTGVGCVDADGDGRRDLVGLDAVDDDGRGTVTWTRTVIERDGLTADEGPTTEGTYRHPADDADIALLRSVTCGGLTLTDDGIPQPEE